MATLSDHAVDRFHERGRVVGLPLMERARKLALADDVAGEHALAVYLPKPVRDWRKPGRPWVHAILVVIDNGVVITFKLMTSTQVQTAKAYMRVLH